MATAPPAAQQSRIASPHSNVTLIFCTLTRRRVRIRAKIFQPTQPHRPQLVVPHQSPSTASISAWAAADPEKLWSLARSQRFSSLRRNGRTDGLTMRGLALVALTSVAWCGLRGAAVGASFGGPNDRVAGGLAPADVARDNDDFPSRVAEGSAGRQLQASPTSTSTAASTTSPTPSASPFRCPCGFGGDCCRVPLSVVTLSGNSGTVQV